MIGAVYFILLSIAILGVSYSKTKKHIPLLILLAVATIMPFVAVRHLPLFAFAVLIFGGPFIADAWLHITKSAGNSSGLPRVVIIATLLLSIGLLIFSLKNFQNIRMPKSEPPFFPEAAIHLIDKSNVTGKMINEFNWGEYALWYLAPKIKISMDGRRETVYSEKVYGEYFSFIRGIGDWKTYIDEYDANIALVSSSGPANNLLRLKSGWELIYEDGTSSIFASQEWDQIDVLRSHAADFVAPPPKEVFP